MQITNYEEKKWWKIGRALDKCGTSLNAQMLGLVGVFEWERNAEKNIFEEIIVEYFPDLIKTTLIFKHKKLRNAI